MAERAQKLSLFNPTIVRRAVRDSVFKLNPRTLMRNPVMFVVEVVAAVTTILFFRDLFTETSSPGFVGQIAAWLWFTVLFANFAEAMAEGRGKAQADTLRRSWRRSAMRRPRAARSWCWRRSVTASGVAKWPTATRGSSRSRRKRA